MQDSKDIFYENIIPKKSNMESTKILFKDSNDILDYENKQKLIIFAKKTNKVFFLFSVLVYLFIIINLTNISIIKHKKNDYKKQTIINQRGKILDRNGEIIATTIKTKDLYVDTRQIFNEKNLKNQLNLIFKKKNEDFFNKIFSKKKYIRIKKDLTQSEINSLMRIGDPSIKFHNSKKRIYLQHNLFSHLTGFKSQAIKSKLEKNLDDKLTKGENVNLTVDLRIQTIVHEELSKSITKYNAKSGLGIVMDVNNGEIISLVSLPDFDPNYPENIK
ncbi:MAG: hypothetical protein CMM95_00705, partial [Rickettsiales bacterium]|nr:hypothetical protein [Rickettsiales bacterium]